MALFPFKGVLMKYKNKSLQKWAKKHGCHPAVAMSIWSISSTERTPEAIWMSPTEKESGVIAWLVESFIREGLFEEERTGAYHWGKDSCLYLADDPIDDWSNDWS